MNTIRIVDLFAGAGGTSTGAVEAIEALGSKVDLTAVNHWPAAVECHAVNHPSARHFCASVDELRPRDLFRNQPVDLLWASPECTNHSRAKGGQDIDDTSRATAMCVPRWAEALRPPRILVENVPEFQDWGPLGPDGKVIPERKGEVFRAWVGMLEALGYRVEHRVLMCADYGDPQTRRRVFVQAAKPPLKLTWPNPTHSQRPELTGLRAWVPAAAVVDWSLPGKSIFRRKKPLRPNTLKRIGAGLEKFGICPSVVAMEHGGRTLSIDDPLPTITCARGGALALAQPCLLPQNGGGALRPLSLPSLTISTSGAAALVSPYLIKYYGTGTAVSLNEPVPTVTAKARFGLVLPEVRVDGETYYLDVLFRMLKLHELAAAQGFRRDYKFPDSVTVAIKMVGNAVPRRTARALVLAVLSENPDAPASIVDWE